MCKVEADISLADSYHELKPYNVITDEVIHGPLRNGTRSVGPISSVFLAGASFDFNLLIPSQSNGNDDEEMIATLGIVRSPGGIETVHLTSTNKVYISSVLDDNEVSKICLADIICDRNRNSSKTGASLIDAFVWTIELLNGQTYCWTVPYRLRGNDDIDRELAFFLQDRASRVSRPKGMCPPTLVCKKESRDKRKRCMLGIICHIGRSSDWMQQSSSGTQSDIALGLVPDSGFGCVLRAGQHARTLHRSGIGGDFDTELFASDFLESEVYGPTEFLMMPPVFVPSIYMLLLEAAYLRSQPPSVSKSVSDLVDHEKVRLEVSATSHTLLTIFWRYLIHFTSLF